MITNLNLIKNQLSPNLFIYLKLFLVHFYFFNIKNTILFLNIRIVGFYNLFENKIIFEYYYYILFFYAIKIVTSL